MAAQVEIAAMGHSLQLAEFAGREKGKSVFDVGRAAGIVAQFRFLVIPQTQPVACQAQVQIPAVAAIAPVLVPQRRGRRMAKKLDLHLLEFPRAEGKIPRRDLVAKTLAHLRDAKGNFHPRAVQDVLEVDENSLGGLGAKECFAAFVADRAGMGLEHQVEFARLSYSAQSFCIRAEHLG